MNEAILYVRFSFLLRPGLAALSIVVMAVERIAGGRK